MSEPHYNWFIPLYKAALVPPLPSGTLIAGVWMEKADVPSTRGNSYWPIKRKMPQLTDEFHGKVMGRAGGFAAVATWGSIRNLYLDLWTPGRVI